MKKTPNFNVGDKVFAKVKGYPPWPACIIAENGKKYNVKFYGTGETGMIKVEDISYYLKNKEKFQKPLKRKDYVDAFEQIEDAIKKDGGDGDPSEDSLLDDTIISLNTSNSSLNSSTSTKVIKKSVKRKRSVSEKSSSEQPTQSPKKRTSKSDEVDQDVSIEEPTPPKKSPEKSSKAKAPEPQRSKDFEFVPINKLTQNKFDTDGLEIVEDDVRSDEVDHNIQIVSEKALKNNIKYASYVKEKESIYKGRPAEPREDYINQVLPIKLPSGVMGGIKLHTEWPINIDSEYDRAIYDELVAERVLEEKQKIESGNTSSINNPHLFIPKIGMTSNFVAECLYLRDIHSKRNRIDRLKIEADLMGIDSKIKNALGLDKADPTQAITYLETMCNLNFDELMLKKHSHVVDMVRRLRKYVGNTKEWNLTEESLNEFVAQAEKIRTTADMVYAKFKRVVNVPPDSGSFWDGFTDLVSKFRQECNDMTDAQIYLLCAEPTSRQAFFDQLEEKESGKENSSGVANSETDPAVVANGGGGTPKIVAS